MTESTADIRYTDSTEGRIGAKKRLPLQTIMEEDVEAIILYTSTADDDDAMDSSIVSE